MGEQASNNKRISLCTALLAHVDAGKTTLSEAMLYCTGGIRTLGRVDHKNAFLDNFTLERQRGITIFSKQATLLLPDMQATLLDTPGHVDFSAETERVLDVLDFAIVVISASEGVQSHTFTLWKLLRKRHIPTFVFVNKMDLPGTDRQAILNQLNHRLDEGFVDPAHTDPETIAMYDETLLEEFLVQGCLSESSLRDAIARGKLSPCWFGAALRLEGVEDFLAGIQRFAPKVHHHKNFAAKVFKITHDDQSGRITHMKLTGGTLRVRDTISGDGWEEKVSQLRVYSGGKFTPVQQAEAGDVVAVLGLSHTCPGMGLGAEPHSEAPALSPVLTYNILLPEGCDPHKAARQLRQLEEEDPQLHVVWNEHLSQLRVQLMGPIQQEVLKELMLERFGLRIDLGPGSILYRETISDAVEGVGHYEPLRHYAEVHLLLEPGEKGSGLQFASSCPEDALDRNWQRLILTHLQEKQHLGVLTGSPITDIKITLTAGRSHAKHTEGGDFRQATYRAVRQGLMHAESVLLEPWYDFRLEVPAENLGKAMTDLQRMGAQSAPPEAADAFFVINGSAPAAALGEYPTELAAYTHGLGRFSCVLKGYEPCREQEEIVAETGYDPEADVENTPDSVFCDHGAGYTVKWSQVYDRMHLSRTLPVKSPAEELRERAVRYCRTVATDKELMAIFERTYGPIRQDRTRSMRPTQKSSAVSGTHRAKPRPEGAEYVLVDGYNIIFAWDALREIAKDNLDAAREKLIGRLRNYQAFRGCVVIVVFDAYKLKGNPGSVEHFGGLSVVYTKEAETADMYIEKATYDLARKHFVRVATSDSMEQLIILGHGALRVPARSFEEEVLEIEAAIRAVLKTNNES